MASVSGNRRARCSGRRSGFDDLVEITVDAAVKAFMVVILGNIAVLMVGSIAGRMIPSAPPGFAPAVEAPASWIVWWTALKGIKFYLVFSVLFFLGFRARFTTAASIGAKGGGLTRWDRLCRRFAENWFGSLVVNAFIAMALSSVVLAMSQLTVWHWLWQLLGGLVRLEQILGEDWMNRLRPWWNWYDHNQLKFNFWLIYLGAVADDLGLPNLKSLARWFWRRWGKSQTSLTTKVATTSPTETP